MQVGLMEISGGGINISTKLDGCHSGRAVARLLKTAQFRACEKLTAGARFVPLRPPPGSPRSRHASSFCTTLPATSVRRKSRPWKRIRQLRVVEAQQVQDRRLQVVDVDSVFDGVVAQLVGLADRSGRP